MLLIQELVPVGSEPNGLQVIAQKIYTVKVVAVVNEDSVFRIETVDQVSAPGVGCKDRFPNATFDNRVRGLYRKMFGIVARILFQSKYKIPNLQDKQKNVYLHANAQALYPAL